MIMDFWILMWLIGLVFAFACLGVIYWYAGIEDERDLQRHKQAEKHEKDE